MYRILTGARVAGKIHSGGRGKGNGLSDSLPALKMLWPVYGQQGFNSIELTQKTPVLCHFISIKRPKIAFFRTGNPFDPPYLHHLKISENRVTVIRCAVFFVVAADVLPIHAERIEELRAAVEKAR